MRQEDTFYRSLGPEVNSVRTIFYDRSERGTSDACPRCIVLVKRVSLTSAIVSAEMRSIKRTKNKEAGGIN